MNSILPLDEYYFEDGSFHLKSKWNKMFRLGLIIGFVIGGLIPLTTTPHQNDWSWSSLEMKYSVKEAAYVDYIRQQNSNITAKAAMNIVQTVIDYADKFKIDEKLILAVIKQESNFTNHLISSSGAMGLMQVMPGIHFKKLKSATEETGTPEPFDPKTNIYVGAWVLKGCLDSRKFVNGALLCYNGSDGSNKYDEKVISHYRKIASMVKGI